MLISECLGNDKGIPELRNAIRHFVKTGTMCKPFDVPYLATEWKMWGTIFWQELNLNPLPSFT